MNSQKWSPSSRNVQCRELLAARCFLNQDKDVLQILITKQGTKQDHIFNDPVMSS